MRERRASRESERQRHLGPADARARVDRELLDGAGPLEHRAPAPLPPAADVARDEVGEALPPDEADALRDIAVDLDHQLAAEARAALRSAARRSPSRPRAPARARRRRASCARAAGCAVVEQALDRAAQLRTAATCSGESPFIEFGAFTSAPCSSSSATTRSKRSSGPPPARAERREQRRRAVARVAPLDDRGQHPACWRWAISWRSRSSRPPAAQFQACSSTEPEFPIGPLRRSRGKAPRSGSDLIIGVTKTNSQQFWIARGRAHGDDIVAASHPLWALLGVNDEAIAALNSQLPPASQVSLSDSPAAAAATLHAALKALRPSTRRRCSSTAPRACPSRCSRRSSSSTPTTSRRSRPTCRFAAKLVVPSALPPQVRARSRPSSSTWSAFERADVGGGGQRPAEAVSRLHARCTKLPAPAKEAVTAAVYERVREAARARSSRQRTALSAIGMRPDEVTTMAETMQDIIPKAAALSQSQAAAVEAAPGGEDAAPRAAKKGGRGRNGQARAAAARAVPPASRAALAEGLHDRDLALRTSGARRRRRAQRAAGSRRGSKTTKLEALAANVAAIGGGGGGAAAAAADDDGYGYAGEPLWVSCARFWCCLCCCFPLPKSVTDTPEFRKGVPTAGILGRAEARSLWQWVRGDPCALRILNFGAGLTLVVVGWLGIWIEAFNSFRVVSMMLDFYVAVGGGVLAAVEVKSALCQSYAVPALRRYVGFLTAARGRGVFMLLLALVSLATVSDDAAVEALNLYATVVLCVLGSFNIAVGAFAERRLAGARARCARATRCARRSRPPTATALARSTPTSSRTCCRARRRALARRGGARDGGARPQRRRRVSEDELLAWWSGAPASARARSAHARPFAWRDATLLQRVTVSAVALYAGGARSRSSARRRRPTTASTRFTPSSTRCAWRSARARSRSSCASTRARAAAAPTSSRRSCATRASSRAVGGAGSSTCSSPRSRSRSTSPPVARARRRLGTVVCRRRQLRGGRQRRTPVRGAQGKGRGRARGERGFRARGPLAHRNARHGRAAGVARGARARARARGPGDRADGDGFERRRRRVVG